MKVAVVQSRKGDANGMSKIEKAIFTNMCMIYDDHGNVVVQDRVSSNWPGITFPGGHVDQTEPFAKSVMREVYEETGLTIRAPKLCGIKQFQTHDHARYVVLLYKTNEFHGTLRSSDEGEVFWIPRADLTKYELANDFEKMVEVIESEHLSEFYYDQDKVKLF